MISGWSVVQGLWHVKKSAHAEGLKGTSPQGMMGVKSIETMREFRCRFWKNLSVPLPLTALHIDAEVVRWCTLLA